MAVYNDMFDHMDGVMQALAKKKTQWKDNLYFAIECAWQKLSKYHTEVNPTTGMLLISAHILDSFCMLWSLMMWDKAMDNNIEDETFYTTQYYEDCLYYVENEYRTKHRRLPVTKPESIPNDNLISSTLASRSGESAYDWYDLSSDDEECIMPNNVAETTPGRSDRVARLLAAAWLDLISPPALAQNCGQINPNLNDYHSDPMESSHTLWLPDITDWWRQQEETHSKYTDLSNVASDILSIIPHGVGVEASFSLSRGVIGWRQSKTTPETLRDKVIETQFARGNHRLPAGDDPELDPTSTDNDREMKREVD